MLKKLGFQSIATRERLTKTAYSLESNREHNYLATHKDASNIDVFYADKTSTMANRNAKRMSTPRLTKVIADMEYSKSIDKPTARVAPRDQKAKGIKVKDPEAYNKYIKALKLELKHRNQSQGDRLTKTAGEVGRRVRAKIYGPHKELTPTGIKQYDHKGKQIRIRKPSQNFSKQPGYWKDVKEVNKGIRWLPATGLVTGAATGSMIFNKIVRNSPTIPRIAGGLAALMGTTAAGTAAGALPQTAIRAKRIVDLPKTSPLRKQHLYNTQHVDEQKDLLIQAGNAYNKEWKQVPRKTGNRQKRHDVTIKRLRSAHGGKYDDVLAQVGLT